MKHRTTPDKLEKILREYDEMNEARDLPQMRLSDLESIASIAGDDYSRTAYAAYRLGFIAGLKHAQKSTN